MLTFVVGVAAILLAAARNGVCAPSIVRSVQSQLPPVARVGQAYTFAIAKSTFQSTTALLYNVHGLPAWATFSAEHLEITGTPAEKDIATTQVTLSATEQGSDSDAAQSSFRLIVTAAPTPTAHIPLAEQLAPSNASAFGNTTAVLSSAFPLPRTPGVRIPPGWSFSLGLDPHSCTTVGRGRVYYGATLASGEALPNWLRFSNQSLTFSGSTPRGAPLQSFAVRFVCADFPDSAAVEQVFAFVVAEAAHGLEVRAPADEIGTVAYGSVVQDAHAAALAALYLDGSPATETDVAKIDVQVPPSLSWLQWNSADNTLRGDVPSSADLLSGWTAAVNVSVGLESSYGTSATLALPVRVYPYLFKSRIFPSVQPARGRSQPTVVVSLADMLTAAASSSTVVTVSLEPSDASSWLRFDKATLALEGAVPSGLTYSSVAVTMSALDATWPTSAASVASFQVEALRDPGVPTDDGLAVVGDSGRSAHRRAVVAMAVLIPVLALLALALLIFCRRRRAGAGQQQKRAGKPQIPVISITASRSWPNLRPGLFGGQRTSASSDTKKLSISCHSQISHTSSWIVGTSIHDGHISVLSPRDGLTLGSFEAISLTQIGSRHPTPKEQSPQLKELAPPALNSGRSTPRRLALVRVLDPELSDEIKRRRTSEDLAEIEFASPTRSDFDATSGSSVASYKWTSPSDDGDLEGEDASDNTLASQRSIPHPRSDFRPPPDGPRLYVRARAEAEVRRVGADAIGRSQQTIQLPGAAFGSHGDFAISDDGSSDDDDDVSCIRVASLVPVGTPTPVREVAVQQVQLEGTPDAALARSQRTEPRAETSSPDRALFGLGYSLGALSQPASAAPSIRLVSPPASPTRPDGGSPKDAPQVVRARVGQRFHFHPQLNPPPAMTPSSGRASPSRARFVATCDDEARSTLPAWLRWDEEALAFWGVPAATDVASVQVRVVETVARRSRDVVVGRVLIVVVKP